MIFKNCAPFTSCISNKNNIQIDNAEYIDVVMPMYNLIEYIDNYSKTSGSLLQYYRDEPNADIRESESFKSKTKITGENLGADNTKSILIAIPLKYLSNSGELLKCY